MARMETNNPTTMTPPRWAGDFMGRDALIPGGARIDPTGFTADANGRVHIPSGTPIGRTIAERDAGAAFGPAVETDDEIFLVAFDLTDAATNADVELYRPGKVVKENFLPGYGDTITALVLAEIRARYLCTLGAE